MCCLIKIGQYCCFLSCLRRDIWSAYYMVPCDLSPLPPSATSDLILSCSSLPCTPAQGGLPALPHTCQTGPPPSAGLGNFFFLEHFCLRYFESSLFPTFPSEFITYSNGSARLPFTKKKKKVLPSFYLPLFFIIVLLTYVVYILLFVYIPTALSGGGGFVWFFIAGLSVSRRGLAQNRCF